MLWTPTERAWRYIDSIPRAISGQGGHDATYHVSCVLVNGFALGCEDALTLLNRWNAGCQPVWSERELRHKIESAAKAPHRDSRGYLLGDAGRASRGLGVPIIRQAQPVTRVISDPASAVTRFLKGFRCSEAELAEKSPVRIDGDQRFDAGLVVERLYKTGERVNYVTQFETTADPDGVIKARPIGRGVTLEREAAVEHLNRCGAPESDAGGWMRMNPVDGRGVGDANVTAFRFTLLESDALGMELQLSLLGRLPLPIALILSSGGRSYHAWVKLDAKDANEYRTEVGQMFSILAPLGIDGKNKNPSRLSRLPGGRRKIGAVGDGWQRLLYLNPEPTGERIFK